MNDHEQRWQIYRVTFDTNIFVRRVIQQDNLSNRLIKIWREKRFILVISLPIIDEIVDVLSRQKLRQRHRYRSDQVTDLINLLHEADIVEVKTSFELLSDRDPKDNMVVDCAITGRVHFLVSYDKDLIDNPELKRNLFEYGVTPIDPMGFLEKIQ